MTGRFFQYLNDIERFFSVVRTSGFILSPRDCERVREWYLKGVPMRVVLDGLVQGLKSFRFHAAPGQRAPHQLSYYSHFIGASVRRFRSEPAWCPPSAPAAEVTGGGAATGDSDAAAGEGPTSDGRGPTSAGRGPTSDGRGPTSDGRGPTAAGGGPSPARVDPNALQWVRQLSAEAALALEREERPEAREALEMAVLRLESLSGDVSCGLPPEVLSHQLQVLDDEILAFYHTRLDDPRRQALEREATARSSRESGLSERAREGRRKAALLALLRADLHLMELAP